ncbi:SDR family oxidoreductase [Herbiconiux ginsengi]|uniref:Short-chain dehydrogenase n=1 Tax=Herbiconiux ginsengi TaxID=381665 RepID=A0A1H3QJ06_9MICO|nr:SDR family oxidoreductase [Herbiconiux ginsengi]SDZ13396.1 Short-chain dehydrogenase [Herbiconiux ginsengi]
MSLTTFDSAVVLVTGANGGLGTEFVRQALEAGAAKVYATARTPKEWADDRVVPLQLDVTDAASIAAAAAAANDVTVVVNNAGIGGGSGIATGTDAELRAMFDTNFFGAVAVARAFAPVLATNGGGALLNVHSVLSWIGVAGAYSAAKAALWSATNSLRLELAPQGTLVTGLHVGWIDTPMAAHTSDPKNDPAVVVRDSYAALLAGEYEVLADELSASVKQGLSAPILSLYPQLAS